MDKRCFVAYGRTESGDDLTPLVFLNRPTKMEVEAIYKELYPEEYSEVGFVSFWIAESEIQDLDKVSK